MKMKPRRTPFYLLAGILGLALSGCSAIPTETPVDLAPEIIALNASTDDEGKTTYTVTFKDGTTATFTVENGKDGAPGAAGNGIKSIAKTSSDGLVDTYTITFTDGTSTTFTITNGASGSATTPTTFKVNFNVNGGVMPADYKAEDYVAIEKGTLLDLPIPTRQGGAFAGWYTGYLPTDGVWNAATPVAKDLTLIAKWTNLEDATWASYLLEQQSEMQEYFYTPSQSFIGVELIPEYNDEILTYVGRIGFCFDREELYALGEDMDWYYAIPVADSIKTMFKTTATNIYKQFADNEDLVAEFKDDFDALFAQIDTMSALEDARELNEEFQTLRQQAEDYLFMLDLPARAEEAITNFESDYLLELDCLERIGLASYIDEIERYKSALSEATSQSDFENRVRALDEYTQALFYGDGWAFENLLNDLSKQAQAEFDSLNYDSELADQNGYSYLYDECLKQIQNIFNSVGISNLCYYYESFQDKFKELKYQQEQYIASVEEKAEALAYVDAKIAELEAKANELGYDLEGKGSLAELRRLRDEIEADYNPGDFESYLKDNIDNAYLYVLAEIEMGTAEDPDALLAEKKEAAIAELETSFNELKAYAEEKGYVDFEDKYGNMIEDFRVRLESCTELTELYQTKNGCETEINNAYAHISDETAPKIVIKYVKPYEKQFVDIMVMDYHYTTIKEGEYYDASSLYDGYSFGGYYSDPEFNELISEDPYFKPDFSAMKDGQSVYLKLDIEDYSIAAKDFSNFFGQVNDTIFGSFDTPLDLEEFYNAAYGVTDQTGYEALLEMAEGLFVPNFVLVIREQIINQPGADELPPEKQEVLEEADAMLDTCQTYEDIVAVMEVLDAVI